MLTIRSFCYHVCFFCVTLVMAIAGLPLLAGPRRWSRWLGMAWSRAVLWLSRAIIGLNYRLEGELPDGPVLIAAKHQSAFETFLFPAIRPDAVFVIKQELLRLPLVGWYLSRAGQIAIDRSANTAALRHMLAQAKERAGEGLSVVIFPEGTRVAVGESAPIRPGVSALYSQLGLPVVPVALDSGKFWARNSFLRRPGTIHVQFGPPIAPGLKRRDFERQLGEALNRPLAKSKGGPTR
jgi:1-acyl-sn-glycerol-3-phosphate acyltransferase